MDLRLVEYFVAVVDHGGITKAAQAMYIAQPSMSQAIKSLERQVGTKLFQRSGRYLELTEAGRIFEKSARRVTRDVALARQRVAAVRELRAGRLQLAAIADLTLDPLPQLVYQFRQSHPDIEVHVSDPGHTTGVVAAVRSGQAEIGLATLPARTESLTAIPIASQRMVLAMRPELAVGIPDPVPRTMLHDLPIMRGPDDRLAQDATDPDLMPPAEAAGIISVFRQATWELVMAGAGIGLMAEGIASSQLSGVEVRGITPAIHRDVIAVFRADQLSQAGSAFLSVLGSFSRKVEANSMNAAATGERLPLSNTKP